MRARIHITGTDRVIWRPADEAAALVAAGKARYAGGTETTAVAPPENAARTGRAQARKSKR